MIISWKIGIAHPFNSHVKLPSRSKAQKCLLGWWAVCTIYEIRSVKIFESETLLVNFALGYLKNIASDLNDEDLGALTESTGKTPQWILGHLRIAAELGNKMLGAEPACGDDWFAAFGPGSKPGDTNAPTFSVSSIVADIEEGYSRLLKLTKEASQEVLAEKHGFAPLEPAISSKSDLMSHLLTTHITYHLAQLSACRQAKGQAPIF